MSHKQSIEAGRRKIRPAIRELGIKFLAARRPAAPHADRPVLRRLMLPLAGALVLLAAGFIATLLWQQKGHLDDAIASSIAAIPEDFSRVLNLQADTLHTALRFIVDNPDMRAALKARDRERLLLEHHALFDTLHQEQGVTHLYFHGPDRANLLRVHSPDKWGDVVNRFTTCEAQRTGKTIAGIELGPLGTFSLRVVEPVFDDEGLIGFVELGKEIEGVLEGLASRQWTDIAVVVHKTLLNRQEWQASMALLGRQADWDRFPEEVLIYNSLAQFPTVLDPYVNEGDLADTSAKLELTFGGTSRRVAFLPVEDVSGTEVGHFIVLHDISSQRQAFARLLCSAGTGCLLLLALLLGFFYVVLKNTDRGIEAAALALRASEAKWRSITKNSADSILLLSPKLEILFMNRPLPDLVAEEPCGRSMLDFIPVESRHSATVCFQQVLRTGKPATYVSEYPLAAGLRGYLESTVGPVLCDGQVTALVVCARDVSDRKRAEEALQQESLFRKAVIANAAEGLCVCHETPDKPFWTFTVWNDRMAEITGYTLDEINDLGWQQLMPPDAQVRDQAVARLKRMRLGEEVRNQEWTVVRHDGQQRTLLASTSLLVSNGCETHILALVQDITERKRAEEQLREMLAQTERAEQSLREGEAKYRSLVDNSLVGIGISQADRILYANQSLLRMCGYDDFTEFASRSFLDYLTPQSRAFLEDWREHPKSGQDVPYVFEHDIVRKDGTIRTLQLSVSPITVGDAVCMQTAFIDITERKQLEERVQDQLQFLQTLMDAIPYPVYYKDAELRYLGCNRACEKLLGIVQDQTVGKTIYDVVPKELADRYHATDVELLAHPGLRTYQSTVMSADGVCHQVLLRKATFQNSDGGVGGIVCVAVDTTELARAEEALLARDSALNSATNGIVLTDLAGKVTYANPSCLKMWGFDHEQEVLDTSFTSLLGSEQEGSTTHKATLDTGQWRGELAARRKDGSKFIVQVSASLVRDKQGKPLCLMASLVDVTEDRRIHDILDRKQKNLEAIFDAAPLGMLLVNEHRRVVRANDTIRQISGKDYRQILNQHPCQVLACGHASPELSSSDGCPACETCSLQKLIEAAFASGSPVHGAETQPLLSREGEYIRPWFSISVEPVSIDGDKHVLIALNDVTGRKEAEGRVRETMELKSQFISTVSHELRTPLTAMKEAVIIVADGIAGKLSKDQTHFLDIARRNIDRLARLIDEVLDFQKLSAGKMKFQMQSNDIGKTVDDAYSTMLPQAQQKQLHLSLDLEPNLPSFVYDHDRMIQVLMNLLSNAIKFTPEKGRVVLRARRQGESLALSVSDTGMGIPEEALPKIFTQFYRVYRPGKEIKGTGLGLAIVDRIVAAHGGRIDVESEVDKGTTFTVVLPLVPRPPAEGMSPQVDARLENALTGRTQT
jgi:PAS domain S-box-containing protein